MADIRYTGETVKINYAVLDVQGLPADLTGYTCMFYLRYNDIEVLEKTCDVAGNVISVTLDPTETKYFGVFDYEFWVVNASVSDCVGVGELELVRTVKAPIVGT